MKSIDEHSQIKRIVRGDPQAFKWLYDTYASSLFRYLWRKTRHRDHAHDMVQEIFTRVWRNRTRLNPDRSIKAYLYAAATRIAIDHLRKKNLHNDSSIDVGDLPISIASHELDLVRRSEIKTALTTLSPTQRTVFGLSRYEQMTYAEIAESLQISVKTVETHMSRALAKLRAYLGSIFAMIMAILEWM